jgi:hypothetical protein
MGVPPPGQWRCALRPVCGGSGGRPAPLECARQRALTTPQGNGSSSLCVRACVLLPDSHHWHSRHRPARHLASGGVTRQRRRGGSPNRGGEAATVDVASRPSATLRKLVLCLPRIWPSAACTPVARVIAARALRGFETARGSNALQLPPARSARTARARPSRAPPVGVNSVLLTHRPHSTGRLEVGGPRRHDTPPRRQLQQSANDGLAHPALRGRRRRR